MELLSCVAQTITDRWRSNFTGELTEPRLPVVLLTSHRRLIHYR